MQHALRAGCSAGILAAWLLTVGAADPARLAGAEKAKPVELTEETYAQWRDHILPKAEELRWQQIPWRPTWTDAVAAAKKEDRPIYVWSMNGHPLGNC